ncbi:XPB/Ssl2-like helicase family protein [Nocardioides albertanoniae]|uniref:XPB/Ssl2-like helicase family protein n=1 Tax=Nocardioides albertanoniae TaxID=1175486 RepID=A0A543A3C8_9ACTN|nr:XPB/Ssl2-like helicase family protein [Nocardioides albertanoniae]
MQHALDDLNHLELVVLDAVVLANQTTKAHLSSMVNAEVDASTRALSHLEARCLVWHSLGGLRAVTGVSALLGRSGGGSGLQPFTGDHDDAVRRLAAVSPEARAMLEAVDAGGGQASSARARTDISVAEAAGPAEELIAHGLLIASPSGGEMLTLPGEVGLALRGGVTTRAAADVAPPLPTSERASSLVDRAAAGAAFEVVRNLELLHDAWGSTPPRTLRGGAGLTVRDLRASAERLHVSESVAALLVEVAWASGLLAQSADEEGDPCWMPTDLFDQWLQQPMASRWAHVAGAWLATPRIPGLVGERDVAGKTWNALAPEMAGATVAETRRLTLGLLADLPAGEVLAAGTGPAAVVARLSWERPRRPRTRTESRESLVAWALSEAETLGLGAFGGLATYGRTLLAGEDAVAVLAELLPAPVDHVLLQGDLTAVAPGPLEPTLGRTLAVVATVESHGGATVYRFTKESVRRAMDRGWTAAEIHAFLAVASRTPVPQALTYLVDDTARTFGTVRVGFAAAYLRSDDETALAELLAHPAADSLGLRRLAPTVVVSTVALDSLLPRLRELGLAPVVEAPDGSVHVARPDAKRAKARARRTPAADEAQVTARARAVATKIKAGDEVADSRPRPAEPATTMAILHEAIDAGEPVVLSYVDGRGVGGEARVEPLGVDGGFLEARVGDDLRTFALSRVRSVRPSQP